jgi:hypothetical protein
MAGITSLPMALIAWREILFGDKLAIGAMVPDQQDHTKLRKESLGTDINPETLPW